MIVISSRSSAPAAATPAVGSAATTSSPERIPALRGRLAALAGAAGAAAIGGGEAAAVTYTPTAGIAAAQGIPDFAFVSSTNVTLGSLRPPATAGSTGWDVDGTGGNDFSFNHGVGAFTVASFSGVNGGQWLGVTTSSGSVELRSLATGVAVNNAAGVWNGGATTMTFNGNNIASNFTTNVSGQFGFRFTNSSDTYYGWGSLVVDLTGFGQGFKVTEAYYNTTPGATINVGAVPVAVPEPASMTLMALGAAGVFAWRARRKAKAAAEAEIAAETET